ncbi:MAG: GntR family transcriptional regulator [Oscillospiraceae bacterium]|nr:GntR family transcriptional regulator [Oscillospiraceae bacterium]
MKKYEFVADSLSDEIGAGHYRSGAHLPTEEQLTEIFGVSRQTVRKALSVLAEKGFIEKKQGSGSMVKIRNPAAGSGKISVIATYIDDYIFPGQLRGVEEVLSKNKFSAILSATKNSICSERQILEDILKDPVAGILVEGTKTALPNPNICLYEKLAERGIPIVFFNSCYPGLKGPLYVCADNRRGGYELVTYLLKKGHRSIAAIFKADDIQGHERYSGYISAMFDNKLFVPDSRTVWYTTETKDRLFDGSGNILSAIGDSTAVVCYNDEIAFMLIKYLTSCGKRVPEDIAVVSFDNSSLSEMSPVKITSLSYDDMNIGTIAARKLADIINGRRADSETIPWKLIEKESS